MGEKNWSKKVWSEIGILYFTISDRAVLLDDRRGLRRLMNDKF